MNENACNYDAFASMHDAGSCSYIFTLELEGATEVVLDQPTTYTYYPNSWFRLRLDRRGRCDC